MPSKEKIHLNDEQKRVISHQSGGLLVVAGAGTGKTRVITERVRDLIKKRGVNPKDILALTFTDKAAGEMLDRIGDVMPLGYEEPWVSTFHSFSDRILRAEGLEIGIDPGYTILTPAEQWILLRKNIFDIKLRYFRPLGNPTKFISAILKFISRLQDENISTEEFSKHVSKHDYEGEEKERMLELALVYKEYQELKIANSYMDFGDLINWSIKLFKDRPNILQKYKEQFKHILVDEFQDTNYAQYELIKLLCPANMENRSLIAVGDDSQSIYKFRGAAISNILQFMSDYPEAETVTLIKNYRSGQELLDPAYKLITNNNPDTLESKLGVSKELVSQIKAKCPKPQIFQVQTIEEEVDFVTKKINELLIRGSSYKDIAILARANSHLDPFVLALRSQNIPYQLVGNRGLYEREEVKDVMAMIRVIVNPRDGGSLYRLLSLDVLNVGYGEIARLLSNSKYKKVDLWEEVESSPDQKVLDMVEKIAARQKKMIKETPSEFIYNTVKIFDYMENMLKEESQDDQLAIKNLNLFLNRAKSFEIKHREDTKEIPTIVNFLDYLELVLEAGENPAQAELEDIDTVNLMTVHASKGLEFSSVFMVNLVSDRFPTRNKSDVIEVPDDLVKEVLPSGDEHIQEERRLFYVGMTRAKENLYMTLAKDYGGKREKNPSGFLNETGLSILNPETVKEENKPVQTSLFGIKSNFRNDLVTNPIPYVPETLSYTQIDTYNSCPLKYRFSFIMKVPTAPNHSLSFGTTMHETLRDFHTRKMFGNTLTLENLFEIYDKNWIPLGYKDEKHRKERYENGKEILKNYYEVYADKNIKVEALEKPFNLKIGNIKFFGKIDRIDRLESGKVEIIDYKTGTIKNQKDVDNDTQVTVYAMAAKEALKLEPEILSLYFLEAGDKISTTRDDQDIEKQKEEIIGIVERMKEGRFEPNPGMQCEWCDFRDNCPFSNQGKL